MVAEATLKRIPEVWKVVIVLAAVFSLGFSASVALQAFLGLPDEVAANSDAIASNRKAIEGVTSEMSLLRLELRVANCLDLKEENDALDLGDCASASLREFLPKLPGALRAEGEP